MLRVKRIFTSNDEFKKVVETMFGGVFPWACMCTCIHVYVYPNIIDADDCMCVYMNECRYVCAVYAGLYAAVCVNRIFKSNDEFKKVAETMFGGVFT